MDTVYRAIIFWYLPDVNFEDTGFIRELVFLLLHFLATICSLSASW